MSYMCVRAYADCGMAGGRRTSPVGRLLPPMGGRLPPTPAAAVTAAVNSRLTNRLVNHRLHTGAYRSSLAPKRHVEDSIRQSLAVYTTITTATLIGGTVQSSGRSNTSLLRQWPAGLAAAVATGGDSIINSRTTTTATAMTVHELTAASAAGTMPMHHLGRSRFMITDILSDNGRNNGGGSPVSPASSTDGPRDLSLHGRASSGSNGGGGGQGPGPAGVGGGPADSDLSDDHESGTDSGLPGDNSSVCSNACIPVYIFLKNTFNNYSHQCHNYRVCTPLCLNPVEWDKHSSNNNIMDFTGKGTYHDYASISTYNVQLYIQFNFSNIPISFIYASALSSYMFHMRRPGLLLLKYFTSREHISPPVVENSICLKGKTVLSRQRNTARYAGNFPNDHIAVKVCGGIGFKSKSIDSNCETAQIIVNVQYRLKFAGTYNATTQSSNLSNCNLYIYIYIYVHVLCSYLYRYLVSTSYYMVKYRVGMYTCIVVIYWGFKVHIIMYGRYKDLKQAEKTADAINVVDKPVN
ncbi:hypothetical protein QTP88_017888 [Uroleucon formosanum]